LIEELAIAALLLWLLPLLGVKVPPWLSITVLALFPVFCYIMYRVGHPTVLYGGVTGSDSIVGSTGMVESVSPEAFVRVQGELWKAYCPGGELKEGEEVVVTAIDGLSLTVSKKPV
jgi:membrane protein implicated in regulation of membrane protease activity